MAAVTFMFHLSVTEAKRLRDKLDEMISGKPSTVGFAAAAFTVRIEQRQRKTKADCDLLMITCGNTPAESIGRAHANLRPLLDRSVTDTK